MRIVGLDLAVTGTHKGVVMTERGEYVSPVFTLRTQPEELEKLLARAGEGADANEAVTVVMESTGHAWLPVSAYLMERGVTVYVVNTQQVVDLRRFYQKHAKSDRIDARVLAKLPLVNPEKLHALRPPSGELLALQRACKQVAWLTSQSTAVKNQIIAVDRLLWLNRWQGFVFKDAFGCAARWCRQHYYHPNRVLETPKDLIQQAWQSAAPPQSQEHDWPEALNQLAAKVVCVYGESGRYIDFDSFEAEIISKQGFLETVEAEKRRLRREVIRPLYRKRHPERHLESVPGVGECSAPIYLSFIGDPHRFANASAFRGWSGMVPRSSQSGSHQGKGLHISQAGPNLIKHTVYLNADVARRYDPQLAKLYYDQMVNKGRHHHQAVCAVATHLLNRILVVLKQDRPYELRDVDGTPLSKGQARTLVLSHYTVPASVRKSRRRRSRQQLQHQRTERRFQNKERESVINNELRMTPSLA